jgi:hypothetical protein
MSVKINCAVQSVDYVEVVPKFIGCQVNIADSVTGSYGAKYSVQLDIEGMRILINQLENTIGEYHERQENKASQTSTR